MSFEKAAFWVGETTGNDMLMKASGDMTPQQEYYLGRSIVAKVVTEKPLVGKKYVNAYVNFIGQYLALHSERPDMFKGYRFAVIDDTTPTAMATPGGFIIISRGFVEMMENEDELAAVLAHEVAHVSHRHSEKNIKNINQINLGKDIVKNLANDPNNKDLKMFTDAIATGLDVTYNKDQEMHADEEAVSILKKAGYAPIALKNILERIPANNDLLSKHPRTAERLSKLAELAGESQVAANAEKEKRFKMNTVF
jgi:predicted Zn-dependent protease